jgi:methyl-accepting chemotaxis protein
MFRFISKSIMVKLIIQFFLVGLTPVLILGALTYYYSKDTLKNAAYDHIASINEVKKEQALEYLQNRMRNIVLLSRSEHIRKMLETGAYNEMRPVLTYHMNVFAISDIILLDRKGSILYAAAQDRAAGFEDDEQTSLEQIIAQMTETIIASHEPLMTDIIRYKTDASPALFMGAPVYDAIGDLDAVIIFQIGAGQIHTLMLSRFGQGETYETYLVGKDLLMRSPSRDPERDTVLNQQIDSTASRMALEKHTGIDQIRDYRGNDVLCAYAPLGLTESLGTEFDWAIITQVDRTEAFELLDKLRDNIFWMVALLVLLVAVVGFIQSRIIARPINDLSYRIVLLNDGDFTVSLPDSMKQRTDEIGLLMNTFNNGTKQFRKQIRRIAESTNLLVASISRISTTASQLAASASETSTSISEVTTTVEEVNQTSLIASEKAQYVSQIADNAAKISNAGKKATDNTKSGIDRIKSEMNYIAESTIKLSEQTKSIEEIINTVSDIADQSNILSVNAAIEAAKAGEHGRGFSVVAQEVKTLANQSKDATNQVRIILEDIQKATSAAVMATERGIKTVEEAVELSEQAGSSIDRLAQRVTEAAEAAMQITASNQQQLTGMDQLSQAMESINDATQQNLGAVKQLEEALKGLEEMVQTMKDITSTYKI